MDETNSLAIRSLWKDRWEYMVKQVVVTPLMNERALIRQRQVALLEAEGRAEYRREVRKKAQMMHDIFGDELEEGGFPIGTVLTLHWNDCSKRAEEARDVVGEFSNMDDGDPTGFKFDCMWRVPKRLLDDRLNLSAEENLDKVIASLEHNLEVKSNFLNSKELIRCPCSGHVQQNLEVLLPRGVNASLEPLACCPWNEEQDANDMIDHMLNELNDGRRSISHKSCLAGLVRLSECFYAGRDSHHCPLSIPTVVLALVRNKDRLRAKGILMDEEFAKRIEDDERSMEDVDDHHQSAYD